MIRDDLSPDDIEEFERVRAAKDENRLLLMSRPNVVGLDIGYRVRDGTQTSEKVIVAFVSRKVPRSLLPDEHFIPTSVSRGPDSFPVDVQVGKMNRAQGGFTRRVRPLVGGASISPVPQRVRGTLGVCLTLNDDRTYLLSCNHVIAGSNQLPIGTPVIQPGWGDGGQDPDDVVAHLHDFVEIDFGQTTYNIFGVSVTLQNPNWVDCAIARIVPEADSHFFNSADRVIHWVGYPAYRHPWSSIFGLNLVGKMVEKMGRTTNHTVGVVRSVTYDTLVLDYDAGDGTAWFLDQIQIEGIGGAFSRDGDSGSLVVEAETKEPVGLLFAGSGNETVANRIDKVMVELGIPWI